MLQIMMLMTLRHICPILPRSLVSFRVVALRWGLPTLLLPFLIIVEELRLIPESLGTMLIEAMLIMIVQLPMVRIRLRVMRNIHV
jgi:hypothetical protein